MKLVGVIRSKGWCMLKTLTLLVICSFITSLVITNSLFNMTGYSSYMGLPSTMSSFAEDLKSRFRGQGRSEGIYGNKIHQSLVDLPDGLEHIDNKLANGSDHEKLRTTAAIKYIVWYNKPVWVNLYTANNALQGKCSYTNCRVTDSKVGIENSSAIVFTLTQPLGPTPPIKPSDRRADQVWIFFGLESPVHHAHVLYRHENWRNTMNWSMSYRLDSDILFPYGMLSRRRNQLENVQKAGETGAELSVGQPGRNYSALYHRKTRTAAWIVSNCGAKSMRDEYVNELQAANLQVDIYGRCSDNVFSDREQLKAKVERDHMFYLSFENSFCKDYVTEKFFRYFQWDVVLVVRGGADYGQLLPNDTFIDAGRFTSAEELVEHLHHVAASEEIYTSYLRNKEKYKAVEYPSYHGSHCHICEKLNNLERNRKSYDDHVTYIHKDMCWTPTDLRFASVYFSTKMCIAYVCTFCIIFVYVACYCRRTRNVTSMSDASFTGGKLSHSVQRFMSTGGH